MVPLVKDRTVNLIEVALTLNLKALNTANYRHIERFWTIWSSIKFLSII